MRTRKLMQKLASLVCAAMLVAGVAACSGESPTEVDVAQGGECVMINGQLFCEPGGP